MESFNVPRATVVALVVMILISSLLPAQSATAESRIVEEIIVTGSHIRRDSVYDGQAPVQTIDSDVILKSGAVQPVDLLKNLTVNTGSYMATEQNDLQGTSQFSLRGLGLSSTLSLLNGRRAGIAPVSDNSSNDFFDLNTIPVVAISRIEVLTDGASATYGSQAVAGVANIVTRKGFEGLELSAGYRDASFSSWDAGFALGHSFQNGGHFNLYGAYYEQDENFRTDFDWLRDNVYDPNGDGNPTDGSYTSAVGSPGTLRRAIANPDGTFSGFPGASFAPDADCEAAGGFLGGPICRMDFADQRTIVAAEERRQLFAEVDFPISDRVVLISEVSFSSNVITDRIGDQIFRNGNIEGTGDIFVPGSHPFNFWTDPEDDGVLSYVDPSQWDPGMHEAVDIGCLCRPLGVEVNGANAADAEREFNNLRTMFGLDIDISDRWDATGYYSYASSKFTGTSDHSYSADPFLREVLRGNWNPFGTRLTNPGLVTPKTVEGDGLDAGLVGSTAGNSESVQALFDGTSITTAKTEQTVLEVIVSGDLFDWGSSAVPLAFGAQYRTLDYFDQPDSLQASGRGSLPNQFFRSESSQDVWAVFAETVLQMGDIGEIQLAVRHEDYDEAGSTTDPKIAAIVRAMDWLSFRGSWGTSFQAPSVFQIAGNTSTLNLSDSFPSNGETCTVVNGSPEPTGVSNTVVTTLQGGGLSPQTAESFNFGVLLSPGNSFSFSLDYWIFDYEDVISQEQSFQAIVDDDCLDDGVRNDPRVNRDASGQLSVVAADLVNIGQVKTEGVDINLTYLLDTDIGQFVFNGMMTQITKFDVNESGGGFVDQSGNRNSRNGFGPTPELRANLGLTWSSGNHIANFTARYIDEYVNDQIGTLPVIDDFTVFDVFYAYSFSGVLGDGSETTVAISVENLTDEDPPGLPTGQSGDGAFNLRPGYDGFVHSVRGRSISLRLKHLF